MKSLVQLADEILEDALPFSDWKQYAQSIYYTWPKGVHSFCHENYYPKYHLLGIFENGEKL